jgi:hypothetical protein
VVLCVCRHLCRHITITSGRADEPAIVTFSIGQMHALDCDANTELDDPVGRNAKELCGGHGIPCKN